MLWDVTEAAELARERHLSSKISLTYVSADDRVVDLQRFEVDGILRPSLGSLCDDKLSERSRVDDTNGASYAG